MVQNFISSCFRGTKRITDLNHTNIRQVNSVTIEDMVRVGKKYIGQLFTPNCRTTIVCHPDKAHEIRDEFINFGLKMTVSTNIDNSILSLEEWYHSSIFQVQSYETFNETNEAMMRLMIYLWNKIVKLKQHTNFN